MSEQTMAPPTTIHKLARLAPESQSVSAVSKSGKRETGSHARSTGTNSARRSSQCAVRIGPSEEPRALAMGISAIAEAEPPRRSTSALPTVLGLMAADEPIRVAPSSTCSHQLRRSFVCECVTSVDGSWPGWRPSSP